MNELMKEYQGSGNSKNRKRNPEALKLLKAGRKSEYYRLRIPFLDPKDTQNINCKYIRYADDFLIGILGDRQMAIKIRDRITI